MAIRNPRLGFLSSLANKFSISKQCARCLHNHVARPTVPSPTPFVPDVSTFLKLIGRDMSKHASKIPSWEQLFTLSSAELRDLGIEPTRQRRYLLRKREKFRQGLHGPGGDLEHVVDGTAQLRVVEVPAAEFKKEGEQQDKVGSIASRFGSSATLSPGMRRVVVNLPSDATDHVHDSSKPLRKFAHVRIFNGAKIKGPFLQQVKGTNGSAALIKVQEGMWEDKQGYKVDGGERRRAEVRAKKRSEERKASA